ncbi:NAD(P)/FAD-dependent oxidoreductase [Nocardia farcinica]|uniref:NAD(P)/FAD-dependent oxidoreductase n=1 Tax=Nocardia farcinica TaxID=37329 RepID=UPI0018949589|nr:FAD-dependent oxidoreductase [Nocardia farcinica]MBF6252949.1 FAD-dependent oxidoreductase [Nocardia farcinica]
MTGQHRIVVLGAGYAGLSAARRLAKKARGTQVTVVDARAQFIERVRLHQRVAGQPLRQWELARVLGDQGIDFVCARATDLDPAARTVGLDTGRVLSYDSLIYALGSTAPHDVPGVAEFARSADTADAADWQVEGAGPVAIVGTGATGIELSTELAESHPGTRVLLLGTDEPGAWLGAEAVAHIRAVLDRLGVEVRTDVKVVEVTPQGPRLADGTVVPAAATVWATGFAVPDLAARAGIAVDALGRVRTDRFLRSLSHPDIHAAGDCALIEGPGGRELRMACATALPTGKHAADTVAARLRGAQPAELRFRYYLQCLSLGRQDGLIHQLRADDTPGRFMLRGRAAALVKEQVVRSAVVAAGLR